MSLSALHIQGRGSSGPAGADARDRCEIVLQPELGILPGRSAAWGAQEAGFSQGWGGRGIPSGCDLVPD